MRGLIRSVLLVAMIAVSALPCLAKPGDTLEQCIARFGKPTAHGREDSTTPEWYAFVKGGYEIQADFHHNVVTMEIIWKKKKDALPTDRIAFTKEEQEEVLQMTGVGKWGSPKSDEQGISWENADGVKAHYSFHTQEMFLSGVVPLKR